jgi:bifunctional DNase/RNase
MPEVVIDSIRVSMVNYQRVVILKEKDTNRYLPIWIGPSEADSIAVRLQEMTVPRPLTHDLLCSLVDSLGGVIESISVSDLQKDTFIATLKVRVNERSVDLDCRPSDALAIAVRAKVAIFVEETVLARASVLLDEDGNPIATENTDLDAVGIDDDELKRLSAFADFIEELDLDDTGKDYPSS